MSMRSKSFILKSYFMISALESAVVFYLIASISSDLKNAVFAGYSLPRLVMLGMAFFLFAFFSFLFVRINLSDIPLNRTILFIDNIFEVRLKYFALLFTFSALTFFGVALFLAPLEQLSSYAVQFERIAPIVYLGSILGVQALIAHFLWRGLNMNWPILFEWKKPFIFTGVVLSMLLVFSAWVAWTGIGIQPETYGWHYPGAPIVFFQLFLAWFVGLIFLVWGRSIENWVTGFSKRLFSSIHLNTIICLILWLGAFLIWWGEPMREESYFNPSPTPPNYEYYPYSDAALYDQYSQNMIIGAEQNNQIILRPLYAFFLVFLHVIGGQQYNTVIFFQVLFLAIMPVLAYLLTSMIGGRSAGILTAILIILREKNAIALTNVIEISHSKLLMSDVPTMALMLLMVYALIKWLKRDSNADYLGIFAGASFGLVMLVRSHQSQVIIPVLFIGMLFSGGFQLTRCIRRVLIFILGFALVVVPWVIRNFEVNGKPAIESSEFYISWYAGAYTEPTDTVDILPGETQNEYSQRIKRQVFQYVIDHPTELARVYISYFVRNEIDSVMALPMSLKLYDPRSYVSHMRFWKDPLIDLTFGSGLIFFFTLGLITFGAGIVVQRLGFLGLLPLLIHFTYNFSMSLARISGWRFVEPVDWIFLLYFCVGLMQLTIILISLFQKKPSLLEDSNEVEGKLSGSLFTAPRKAQFFLAFFFLLGLSFPLVEKLFPERYPDIGPDQVIARFIPNGFALIHDEEVPAAELKNFLETEAGATVLYGRALYPTFYKIGQYWGDQASISYLERNFNRLHFTLIGFKTAPIFIRLDIAPEYFPHASDVFIVGCDTDDGVRALAVKVNDRDSFITASPWRGLTCAAQ